MRKELRMLAMVSTVAFVVTACGTVNPFTGKVITQQDVINATKLSCSFLPAASTITNLITANPSAQTAEAIAALICGSVLARRVGKLGAAAAFPPVRGVAINGHFI